MHVCMRTILTSPARQESITCRVDHHHCCDNLEARTVGNCQGTSAYNAKDDLCPSLSLEDPYQREHERPLWGDSHSITSADSGCFPTRLSTIHEWLWIVGWYACVRKRIQRARTHDPSFKWSEVHDLSQGPGCCQQTTAVAYSSSSRRNTCQ